MPRPVYKRVSGQSLGFDSGYRGPVANAAKAATNSAQYANVYVYCVDCNSRHLAHGWLANDIITGKRDTHLEAKSCHKCRHKMEMYVCDEWSVRQVMEDCVYMSYRDDSPEEYNRILKAEYRRLDNVQNRFERLLVSGEKFARMVELV